MPFNPTQVLSAATSSSSLVRREVYQCSPTRPAPSFWPVPRSERDGAIHFVFPTARRGPPNPRGVTARATSSNLRSLDRIA